MIRTVPERGTELERTLLACILRQDGSVAMATRTFLLGRRDALYDDAVSVADPGLRALAVARAEGIEGAVKAIEMMLRP